MADRTTTLDESPSLIGKTTDAKQTIIFLISCKNRICPIKYKFICNQSVFIYKHQQPYIQWTQVDTQRSVYILIYVSICIFTGQQFQFELWLIMIILHLDLFLVPRTSCYCGPVTSYHRWRSLLFPNQTSFRLSSDFSIRVWSIFFYCVLVPNDLWTITGPRPGGWRFVCVCVCDFSQNGFRCSLVSLHIMTHICVQSLISCRSIDDVIDYLWRVRRWRGDGASWDTEMSRRTRARGRRLKPSVWCLSPADGLEVWH